MVYLIKTAEVHHPKHIRNDLIHPNFYDHTPEDSSVPSDRDSARGFHNLIHARLSEIKIEITQCICTSDMVATNKVLRGRLTGDFFEKSGIYERSR